MAATTATTAASAAASTRAARRSVKPAWLAVPVGIALLGYALWPSSPDRAPVVQAPAPATGPVAAAPQAATPPVADRPAATPAPAAPPAATASVAAAAPTPAPAPAAPAVSPSVVAAVISLTPGVDDGTEARLAGELAQALAAPSRRAATAKPVAWPAGFAPVDGQPQLALAHYDALQAAKSAAPAGGPRLQVLAPLYTESLYFVVRADSPLQSLHEMRDARVNFGPPDSGRALTAAHAFEALFGSLPPATPARGLDAADAMKQLVAGAGVDVVVLVGAEPAAWLAALPPEAARMLRLLRLDRGHPTAERALQHFLPATLAAPGLASAADSALTPVAAGATGGSAAGPGAGGAAGAGGTPGLALMTFLVTTQPPAGRSAAGDAPSSKQVSAWTHSLCAAMPGLRRDGHPKWRGVDPALQLDVGWPQSAAALQGLRGCASGSGPAAPRAAVPSKPAKTAPRTAAAAPARTGKPAPAHRTSSRRHSTSR